MIFLLFLTAALWGFTDPLLKRYSQGVEPRGSIVEDVRFLISKPKYLIVQVSNLIGSVIFFYGLRDVDVCVGSIVTNSLAFIITVVVSSVIFKEEPLNLTGKVGCLFVLMGTALCTLSSTK